MTERKPPEPRRVRLTTAQRRKLGALLKGHEAMPRERIRAQILLQSHRGWDRVMISEATGASVSTVGRVRRRFCESGLRAALAEKARSGGPRKLTASQEQAVVALVCTNPPEGFARWSIRLLTEEVHRRKMVTTPVSRERIRMVLQEHGLKPWREKNVVRTGAQ